MIEDTYKYNSVDVAKYLVAKMNEKKMTVNMTKVQKLLYICYGVFLAVRKSRLLNEHPQAWPYGPVFPTVRNKLLSIGNLEMLSTMDACLKDLIDDDDLTSLIETVLATYGKSTAKSLVIWSHRIDSPWSRTTNMLDFKWGATIPDEYTYDYFFHNIIKHE